MSQNKAVKVRIAPSPTGEPHVGTAYIGLFNLAFARSNGGSFILRVEDTDQERSTRESEESIYRSLEWLGISFDESPVVGGDFGPYRQSERTSLYEEHCQRLIENGNAYRCFCTRERMEALRVQQKEEGKQLGYDGHCRGLTQDQVDANRKDGIPCVIRLKMPKEGETVVHDLLRGQVVSRNELVDDQILLKTDGFPTYHLANVVDDHLMGVTHVIRAEEWIPSTPKHVVLYRAFGWEEPVWIHMPLLRNPDKGKSKISKRKNPVSLLYYRDRGFLPEALVNYLSLMGWSFPSEEEKEIFTLSEFIENFDITRVSLGGPVFDLSKLEWMNGNYLRALDDGELARRLCEFYENDDFWNDSHIEKLVPLLKERMTVLSEFDDLASFYHGTTFIEAFSPLLLERGVSKVREGLNNLRTVLENKNPYWNRDELATCVSAMKEDERGFALSLFGADSLDSLSEKLFFRGKTYSLKLCKDGANTLKKLLPKKISVQDLATVLTELVASFQGLDWTEEALESRLKGAAEEKGWGAGDLLMPVRIGCLGKSATPGLYESMVAAGRERCSSRLASMVELLKKVNS